MLTKNKKLLHNKNIVPIKKNTRIDRYLLQQRLLMEV